MAAMLRIVLLLGFVMLGLSYADRSKIFNETCSKTSNDASAEQSYLSALVNLWSIAGQFHIYPSSMPSMPMDIAERTDSYVIQVDLPGVEKDTIKVTVAPAQNEMQISAFKKASEEPADSHFTHVERHSGHLSRTVWLPHQAKVDELSAKFKEGVLEIRLPKVAALSQQQQQRFIGVM